MLAMYYVPCPNIEVAKKIARIGIEQKVIACANILPQMESIYFWQGQIESSSETLLIIKTDNSVNSTQQIQEFIKSHHPYEVPCVVELSINSINEPYLNWIQQQLT